MKMARTYPLGRQTQRYGTDCQICGNPTGSPRKKWCKKCEQERIKKRHRKYKRKWMQRNPEEYKQSYKKYNLKAKKKKQEAK